MQSAPPNDPVAGWSDSLYTGACGIALLHMEYARTGAGDWGTAHRWAVAMTRSPVTAHPDSCGLGRGAPAVAFVLHAADQPGYAPALATLDRHIATLTRHRLRLAHQRIEAGQRPSLREFDLIRGLTGIGAYLLRRHGGDDLLRDVLRYLVRLAQPLEADDGEVLPGWWTANAPNDRPSREWPDGHGNLGLAHGIAGPLALLSMAMRRGITVTGQADAIVQICAWLDQWRTGAGPKAWWPGTISAAEHRVGTARRPGPGRPSWCYGTPGLVRAQQLAALALGDPQRQLLAEQALAGCVADEHQLARLNEASLCHGWAGLLQTTWRVAGDAHDPERFAVRQLLTRIDEHMYRYGPPTDDGLLGGRTGVLLARHTVAADVRPASGWDACLLLDDGTAESTHSERTCSPPPSSSAGVCAEGNHE